MPNVSDLVPRVSSLLMDVSVESSNDSVRALSDSASSYSVRSAGDVIAGDGEEVKSLCDSLSDKMTVSSSGVSSRGNSRTVINIYLFNLYLT